MAVITTPPIELDQIDKISGKIWRAMDENDVSTTVNVHQRKLNQMLSIEQLENNLFIALQIGDIEEIERILKKDSSLVHSTDTNGNTPMHYAALGSIRLLRFLVENGARTSVINAHGFSPLLIAASSTNPSHIPNFNFLVKIQDYISDEELSVLFHLVTQQPMTHSSHLKTIFDLGLHNRLRFSPIPDRGPVICVNPYKYNCLSVGGLTILHEAVIAGNYLQASIIIEQDLLDTNVVDSSGNTPLHYSVSGDVSPDLNLIDLLLKQPKIEVNLQNKIGNTPLHNAVLRGNLNVLRKLLNHPNLLRNIPNKQGLTPLFFTFICSSEIEIARLLLEQASLVNFDGQSILHIVAASRGWNGLIVDIRQLEIDINAVDCNGNTALHLAIINLNIEMATYLIDQGADINIENHDGVTPRELSENSSNVDVKELMSDIHRVVDIEKIGETSFAAP